MNRLVVDEVELKIENLESILDVKQSSLRLICNGINKIVLNAQNNFSLDIILLDNSFLDISIFNRNKEGFNKVIIEQKENTEIKYKESFETIKDCTTIINNIIVGDNNKSDIKLRCIANDAKSSIDVLANVLKGTKDNEIIEDIKGINHGGLVEIKPNMEINTSEVIANHYVTIGTISANDLFYLESKGLSEDYAKKIILEGFLKSIMIEDKENIDEWR